jgi:hypothetical protein
MDILLQNNGRKKKASDENWTFADAARTGASGSMSGEGGKASYGGVIVCTAWIHGGCLMYDISRGTPLLVGRVIVGKSDE